MSKGTRNLTLAGVAVVLLIVAGYRFYGLARTPALPQEFSANAVCLSCKGHVPATAKIVERPPYLCPKCGQQSVYPWLYCMDCKRRFVPELIRRAGEAPRVPPIPACPNCGGTRTGGWIEGDEEQTLAAEDLPLPAWP